MDSSSRGGGVTTATGGSTKPGMAYSSVEEDKTEEPEEDFKQAIPVRLTETMKRRKLQSTEHEEIEIEHLNQDDDTMAPQLSLTEQMRREKARYPGAATWAEEEEKLFEILFLRQDLGILPAHWAVDFRSIPVGAANFSASDDETPLVFAHGADFPATVAIIRLIELTSDVRTAVQSGLRHRVPNIIKKGLDSYLSWAAEDGGYGMLQIVPNVITEVIDASLIPESDITDFMQNRMRALSRLQREFFSVDFNSKFWNIDTMTMGNTENERIHIKKDLLWQKYLSPKRKRVFTKTLSTEDDDKGLSIEVSSSQSTTPTKAVTPKKQRISRSSLAEINELAVKTTEDLGGIQITPPSSKFGDNDILPRTPERQEGGATPEYRRRPPVIYGLFILNTSIFVLTMDSSQGDDGYISYHVETDMSNRRQCVWNGLTLAIVCCMARDDMKSRLMDFKPSAFEADSDPDV